LPLPYKLPPPKIRNKIGLMPGLDIIGDGGYIIVSPSTHASGNSYRWLKGHHPMLSQSIEVPGALLAKIEQASAPIPTPQPPKARPIATSKVVDKVERAKAYADKMDPAYEGQSGDRRTFVACSVIARGFDLTEHEALEVLRPWNQRCVPPWSEYQLRTKIRRAMRYGREPVGGRLLA
jgi:hypothetical protein